MITCEDWRDAPASEVGRLFDAECARWRASLGWDNRAACQMLQAARARRHLPGFLARSGGGALTGWTYFQVQQSTLHVGNLVASDDQTPGVLLEAIQRVPEAKRASRLRAFLYPTLPAVEHAFERAGCTLEPYRYLRLQLAQDTLAHASHDAASCVLRTWSSSATGAVVKLFACAYQGIPHARCFAEEGRIEQWATYVGQIVQMAACGRFSPALSLLAHTPSGDLAGVALVTVLSDRTAHIAQMAVEGEHRRQGIGARLVRTVCERACAAGFDGLTLLVADSNKRAERLYVGLGFEFVARFIYASRP